MIGMLKRLLRERKTNYHRLAALVYKVSTAVSDERGAKCGYDLLVGLEKGDVVDRCGAWIRYLKEVKDNESHVDAQRDGVWVPAIQEK